MNTGNDGTSLPPKRIRNPFPLDTRLDDGTRIRIRPVEPGDKHLFEVGMAQLSDRSRQFRFMHAVSVLSPETLRQFTEIDHRDHEAMCAFEPMEDLATGAENLPVGVARYIRDPKKPSSAEVAVTVIDRYHGHGVGTLLLAILAWRAVANSVSEFSAMVQSDNRKMLEVFAELGGTSRFEDPGIVGVRIPLHADAALYPSSPAGDVVRTVWSSLQSD